MAFVAIVVAGQLGNRDWIENVVEHYDDPEAEPALISGLGWLPWERVSPLLDDWLVYHAPRWRALGLAAAIAHRRDPRGAIDRGLLDDDPRARGQAIRGCRAFGRRCLVPTLLAVASEADDATRCRAATALVALGQDYARILLWQVALRLTGEMAIEAVEVAIRWLSVDKANSWIEAACRSPQHRMHALVAAAATGSPVCAHHMLNALDDPYTAALAMYGLSTAFGLNPYAVEAAEAVAEGHADPGLPYPDVSSVYQWWAESAGQFDPRHRWLAGQVVSPVVLRQVLVHGVQHQRRLAARDLQRSSQGALSFEVDAPGWYQLSRLGLSPRRRKRLEP